MLLFQVITARSASTSVLKKSGNVERDVAKMSMETQKAGRCAFVMRDLQEGTAPLTSMSVAWGSAETTSHARTCMVIIIVHVCPVSRVRTARKISTNVPATRARITQCA